jgi:hypothetical protein
MDSRFTTVKMIKGIRATSKGAMHVIGLVKMGTRKYDVGGQSLHIA